MEESERRSPALHPLVRALLGLFAAPRINMREDYEKVRRLQRQLAAMPVPGPRVPYRETTVDDIEHPVPVRIFSPLERRRDEVLLFFHGGGWVTGDIESYTPACANLAELTGCKVVSVNYRLAPEHPFPAGLQDCLRVARLLLEEPHRVGADDPSLIVLVGDSAGGNLAAVVSQMLRDEGPRRPDRQILLYPVTHWDHDPKTSPFASVRDHGHDYRLTTLEVQDYFALYVPEIEKRCDPKVAPLLAEDLTDQPDTLLISAELDLLCDEGEAYGHALAEAGNSVRIERIPDALHGFITLPRFSRSLKRAYEAINRFLDGEDAPHAGPAPQEAG